MGLDTIRQLTVTELQQTNLLICEQLQSTIPFINELSNYILHSGGKRLRPLLTLLSAKMFNYQGDAHIKLAAIVEFIHTATLLHDDVVDTSLLRRGRKTANAIWGNEASVLVGDFLYSRAFQMVAALKDMRVAEVLADATNQIAEGEVLQLINCGNSDVTEAHYYRVIEHKTAKLFEAATELGATISHRPDHEIFAMKSYGRHLGIAYQLIDDALDYSGSIEIMGKNLGDDLAEGKTTLPLIYVLQQGSHTQHQLVREAVNAIDGHLSYLPDIQAAVESTGAITYTINAAKKQAQHAIDALRCIPPSSYRDALISLANFAVERNQ